MTEDLRLGLVLGYWGAPPPEDPVGLARLAEELDFSSVWTSEAYGSDAITPLCWVGAHTSRIELGTAIVQLSARTPASTAMTAATLDHLSGGRFTLGLGVSGPQVVEGWYGQPFSKPLARTREYVAILRAIWAREEPVRFPGEHYPLPHPGGMDLGKPLKITVHPLRGRLPVLLAAEGPRNVALAAEIADGWLPIFCSPERSAAHYADSLTAAPEGFRIVCPVTVVLADDVTAGLEQVKWSLAFYIGGMGAKDANFHLNLVASLGFEEEGSRVQELFLEGRREEAMRAVPDELADEIALVGPAGRITERLGRWRDSPVTDLIAGTRDPEALRTSGITFVAYSSMQLSARS